MVPFWREALPALCSGLAASILASPAASHGESICRTPTAGFDCSPLGLEEALAPTTLAQHQMLTPDGSTSSPASGLNPDSEEVLEQEAREGNREALAKQAQNPIANLISVPIQWNSTPGSQWAPRAVDPSAQANRTFNVWNVQPVVPFPLNDNFMLVSRTIVPVIHRPLAGETDVIGIGDINPTLFLVPRTRGNLMVGFGPTLVIPSATDVQLSSQRWSAGPAAAAVFSKGSWVGGVLVNNVWSFAGDGGRDVNAMLIQPFLNYNLPAGWYLISSPIITADWTAPNGKGWTIPIGGGFGRLFQIGSQPFNTSLQAFWNVAKPDVLGEELLGDVTIRLQIQALFPTGAGS
ncbi:MAG: neuromedin U [Cyanobacteriota bacterium]|jgi:hypothetical protein